MTYIVRPRIEPANSPLSVSLISAGGAQLLVGPASRSCSAQMKVRSSTRATSLGCERARKEFGRLTGSRRVSIPLATASALSRSHSSCEPSAHSTRSGCVSSATSRTQVRSLAFVVGRFG